MSTATLNQAQASMAAVKFSRTTSTLPVAPTTPVEAVAEPEGRAFYIVTTVAGVAMIFLAITAVSLLGSFLAMQLH